MYGDSSQAYYSGGVSLDHEDPRIVYLSKRMPDSVTGNFQLQKATTTDKGETWTFVNITNSSYKYNSYRPVVVRNHTSDFNVIWLYGVYDSFSLGKYYTKIYSDKLIISRTNMTRAFIHD